MIQQTTQLEALFPTCRITEHATEADWLADRQSGIGASESASVFGCGYAGTSPLTVWASKVKGYRPEFSADQLRRMNRGKKLEPIIAEEFAEETALEVIDPGDYTILRHAEHDWLFATIDRVCISPFDNPALVEIKAVSTFAAAEWKDDEAPTKHQVQAQHQMAVTGAKRCYLVGLIGGDELAIRVIERDDRFITAMIATLANFWRYVETEEMPPVDGAEGTTAALSYLFPHETLDATDLPDDAAEWDRELLAVKDEIKTLETRKAAIENRIKALIGDHERGNLPGSGGFTWKAQTRKGIDTKRLREEFPEAAEACETKSEFRVLRRTDK